MHTPEEEALDALVCQAQAGNERAWATLVELYKEPLWRYQATLTNLDVAEDRVQETLIKAWLWLHRKPLAYPQFFQKWLYQIAHNVATDWLRRQRLERQYNTLWEETDEYKEDPNDFTNGVTQRDLVQSVLNCMPRLLRECLILHDERGFSPAEIAIILGGLKESSVRTYLSNARRLFRSLYISIEFGEQPRKQERNS